MHGGYARPPCGVTLTGSVRAHVPHALFLSPAHRAWGSFLCAGCSGRGDPPAAVSWRSGCGISPIKYVPRLIAYSLVLISL